jgi:hypothetical protein
VSRSLVTALQLFDFTHRQMLNIETAGSTFLVTQMPPGKAPMFHANMYVLMCRFAMSHVAPSRLVMLDWLMHAGTHT